MGHGGLLLRGSAGSPWAVVRTEIGYSDGNDNSRLSLLRGAEPLVGQVGHNDFWVIAVVRRLSFCPQKGIDVSPEIKVLKFPVIIDFVDDAFPA